MSHAPDAARANHADWVEQAKESRARVVGLAPWLGAVASWPVHSDDGQMRPPSYCWREGLPQLGGSFYAPRVGRGFRCDFKG